MEKTIKVGKWYKDLTPAQKEFFSLAWPSFGSNTLRTFFTASNKYFGHTPRIYSKNLTVSIVENSTLKTYYFSPDRKDFNFLMETPCNP